LHKWIRYNNALSVKQERAYPRRRFSGTTTIGGAEVTVSLFPVVRAQDPGPANDKHSEEATWFTRTTLLGPRSNMDQMAEAIRKIQKHAGDLARS
jgi:hypothetical protein